MILDCGRWHQNPYNSIAVNDDDYEKAKAKKAALGKRISNLAKARGKQKRGAPKLGRHIHGDNKKSNYDYTTAREAIGIPHANNQQINSVLDPPRPYQSREDMQKTIAKAGRTIAKEKKENVKLQKQVAIWKDKASKHKREKRQWMARSRERIKALRDARTSLYKELLYQKKSSDDFSKGVMENANSTIQEAKVILLKAQETEARAVDTIAASQTEHDIAMMKESDKATESVWEKR